MALLAPLPAWAERPLSAIDWLSSSVATPAGSAVGRAVKPKQSDEPPVSQSGALPSDVAVSRLDSASADAIGLLDPAQSGLPENLWGIALDTEVGAAITGMRTDLMPALRHLMHLILETKATPPVDNTGKGALLLQRVDQLLNMGALEPAKALLAAASPENPEFFRRSFDVALLTGTEEAACEQMQQLPTLAPTFPARIFCLARSGDWNAAALTLRTAQVLGQISDEEDALLQVFLDPELYDPEATPPLPARMTPLSWRMFEAIGELVPTTSLPLAFAHAELRDIAGWRSQIEAAERLVRAGAIEPQVLFDFYAARAPAASGGVWDRVAPIQKLNAALDAQDQTAISAALIAVWPLMAAAELETAFADVYAERLHGLDLTAEAKRISFDIGLLSDAYQRYARETDTGADERAGFLKAVALGDLQDVKTDSSLARAIKLAFTAADPAKAVGDHLRQLQEDGRKGEALIYAAGQIAQGVQGELDRVSEGLAYLRLAGFDDLARRTALELMLLDRRG